MKNKEGNVDMKKIALICSSLSNGGAEKTVSVLSKQLSLKYDVYLFLLDGNDVTYDYSGTIVDLGKHIKQINGRGLFSKILYYMKYVNALRAAKKRYEPDCCISFLESNNIFNILSRRSEKIIVSVRSTRSLQTLSRYERIENKGIRLYNKVDKVISISEGVRYDLIENFNIKPEKVKTIYNPYSFDDIVEKSMLPLDLDMQNIFNNHKVIVNVGRLVKQKCQDRLIDEFRYVLKEHPDAFLVIVGSGSEEKRLKDLVKEYELDKFVKFIPFTNNPFNIMKNSSVFAFPSEREGYGNVIIEAMACGIPVVVADCMSGPREIIAGLRDYSQLSDDIRICDRGILVPILEKEKKPNTLSAAINMCLSDDDMRMVMTKNASSYLNTYSVDNIINQWCKVIDNDAE